MRNTLALAFLAIAAAACTDTLPGPSSERDRTAALTSQRPVCSIGVAVGAPDVAAVSDFDGDGRRDRGWYATSNHRARQALESRDTFRLDSRLVELAR